MKETLFKSVDSATTIFFLSFFNLFWFVWLLGIFYTNKCTSLFDNLVLIKTKRPRVFISALFVSYCLFNGLKYLPLILLCEHDMLGRKQKYQSFY